MARDWLKEVGGAFSKVGEGVRSAADEARKTVGIGVGQVSLALSRHDFRPGDTITGTVTLALSEPTEAKRVVVALTGSRKNLRYTTSGSQTSQSVHHEQVYEHERELAGAGEYQTQQFAFELTVPTDDPERVDADGVVGDVARAVNAVRNFGRTNLLWRVTAFVDVPWKRNVKASVDVSVS